MPRTENSTVPKGSEPSPLKLDTPPAPVFTKKYWFVAGGLMSQSVTPEQSPRGCYRQSSGHRRQGGRETRA